MVALTEYEETVEIAWCPGCGNFGILKALRQALVDLDIRPEQLLLVSGIGQGPKLPHYMKANVFNGLHGRTLPAATGAKLANHELFVIGIDGDGGAYGEGTNHLLAAMRRNLDITYMAHNNQVYGLTKGQASPTSDLGFITKTTPMGAGQPVHPIALAIASDCSFVARGFSGYVDHLSGLLKAGIQHPGFALIDILQPCVSFNHTNTFEWYSDRVYKLEEEGEYEASDRAAAFARAQEWGDRIPIGVIFREQREVYEKQLPALRERPLVDQELNPLTIVSLVDEFI